MDMNYFKNIYVLLFLSITTILFVIMMLYRRFHGFSFKSFVTFLIFSFYLMLLALGIYFSYNEVLANFYYEKNLYNEASYRYIQTEKIRKTFIYKTLNPLLFFKKHNSSKNKMMSFYASKNYSRAIPYLLKNYKKTSNFKEKIFIKLYLAHSYLETGNQNGKQIFKEAYIEALCKLSPKDLSFFEEIIQLNAMLKNIISV